MHRCIWFSVVSLLFSASAHADPPVTMYLNWIPGPEHAALYFAKKAGWYTEAGVDLSIVPGGGSASTLRLLTENTDTVGVADFSSVITARGNGASVIAVMSLFANSPYTFVSLKKKGVHSIRDLPGKRIGVSARDPGRSLWRALAELHGLDPTSVTWVEMAHADKVAALRDGSIDVAINGFLDSYAVYSKEFGDALVQIAWREIGLVAYSNSLVVSDRMAKENPILVTAIVRATQRALAACIDNPGPCIDALVESYPHLQRDREMANWIAGRDLFFTRGKSTLPLGAYDRERVSTQFELVRRYLTVGISLDPSSTFTNSFLDLTVSTPQ